MRTTARVITPIILLVAIELFLQGHNLPGGGFIGGVLTTTAFVVIYIAYSLDFLEEGILGHESGEHGAPFEDHVVTAYRRTLALGLVIAAVGGLVPLLLGLPFLSQSYVIVEGVPIYHEIELASAIVFDLGIFCVVVGGVLTIVSVVAAE